jgi:hypothetical protein
MQGRCFNCLSQGHLKARSENPLGAGNAKKIGTPPNSAYAALPRRSLNRLLCLVPPTPPPPSLFISIRCQAFIHLYTPVEQACSCHGAPLLYQQRFRRSSAHMPDGRGSPREARRDSWQRSQLLGQPALSPCMCLQASRNLARHGDEPSVPHRPRNSHH